MATKTRLGIGSLLSDRSDSIEFPEEVTLFCPQCGEQVAGKGQCLADLAKVPGNSKTGFVVKIIIVCGKCGCYGEEAAAL